MIPKPRIKKIYCERDGDILSLDTVDINSFEDKA
jgi:hypothetical protein